MTCLCCGEALEPYRDVAPFRYLRCVNCGFTSLSEQPAREDVDVLYGDDYFTGGGAGYATYDAEGGLLRERGRYYGRLLQRFAPAGTLLDVGAASGFIVRGFKDEGWNASGIEPNESMAMQGRHAGIDVQACCLEELDRPAAYDVVSMIQVVAHMYDIQRALTNAAAATTVNGLWLVETWNGNSLTARIFGRHWHEYSPPTVVRVFTPRALTLLAVQFGFRFVAMGRPQKRILASHAKSLVAGKAQGSAINKIIHSILSRVPDDLQLPYPAEDLFWALYQKLPRFVR